MANGPAGPLPLSEGERKRRENPGRLDTSSEPGTFPGRCTAPLLVFPFPLFISAKQISVNIY
jgi:hypothetical protein